MTEKINAILGIDDIFKAPDRLLDILLDKPLREKIFLQFFELFDHKLENDFFHSYFQAEAAQRKKMSQDFTPMSVASLVSQLVESKTGDGMYFEPSVGTGGMMIAKWHSDRIKENPIFYKPSQYMYVGEELSDRAFPFLVFNMAIRGMNGAAVHCDSLTRECYGVFFMQNDDDNPSGFSSINIMPYTSDAENFFKVSFVNKKYLHHVESQNLFARLT